MHYVRTYPTPIPQPNLGLIPHTYTLSNRRVFLLHTILALRHVFSVAGSVNRHYSGLMLIRNRAIKNFAARTGVVEHADIEISQPQGFRQKELPHHMQRMVQGGTPGGKGRGEPRYSEAELRLRRVGGNTFSITSPCQQGDSIWEGEMSLN